MPIVHECAEPTCPILTMGEYCIDHEREHEHEHQHEEPELLEDALAVTLVDARS